MGLRRREVLTGVGALTFAPALLRHAHAADTPPFALGIASGQPRVDGMVLWTRLTGAELGERVAVSGEGAAVQVDADASSRALSRLAKAASRHGGIESVTLVVRGPELEISPLLKNAAGVVTGEELRELGAVVAFEHLKAIGVEVTAEDERLLIRFPG